MTLAALRTLIEFHNHPELADAEGMVYQVWNDGEITLQKSGSLLGQRHLHCIRDGQESKAIACDAFPTRNSSGFAYIYTDKAGAESVSDAILNRIPS